MTTGAIAIDGQNAGNSVEPKVILSRLILVCDDGGKWRQNAGNSVEPKFEFLNLNYSALLADKRPNEVPFNRPKLDVICVQRTKKNIK